MGCPATKRLRKLRERENWIIVANFNRTLNRADIIKLEGFKLIRQMGLVSWNFYKYAYRVKK